MDKDLEELLKKFEEIESQDHTEKSLEELMKEFQFLIQDIIRKKIDIGSNLMLWKLSFLTIVHRVHI